METINVSLKKKIDDSYPIIIKQGLLAEIRDHLSNSSVVKVNNKILIVTDSNVGDLYGQKLYASLQDNGFATYLFSFPAGEEQKNINTKLDIEKFMFENGFGRDSLIIALGGGVVGDIAGFTASTFNRGIPYIQVPTTIVAQSDSSIGGKTAIDVPYGKNLIGTFYQPKMVLIDPAVLLTLADQDYYSGMGEVIKHAIIKDKELFSYLKNNRDALIKKNLSVLEKMIAYNCQIKRKVVEQDEKEGNLRMILNYGHTIGHAIEKLTHYKMLHGECVAIGMAVEADISNKMAYLDSDSVKELKELIRGFNLPHQVPGSISIEDIYQATFLDKKTIQNRPRYSLPESIGTMLQLDGKYSIEVEQSLVFDAIKKNQDH